MQTRSSETSRGAPTACLRGAQRRQECSGDGVFEAGRVFETVPRLDSPEKRCRGQRTPKPGGSITAFATLVLAVFTLVSPCLHAATRTSADYSIIAETMDAGGGAANSANYASVSSLETGSVGDSASGSYSVQHGHITAEIVAVLIEGQWVFYNHSEWDGNNAGPDANDDHAIAPDKSALLPGGIGSYANYTSYSRGLNGIMVDIAGLAGTPTASDFTFKTGNNHTPAGWAFAPDPVSVTVRPGAGANGSDRVTLTWNDNNLDAIADANEAVAKAWLEVTVLPTATTGLAAAHTFYFGNAVGEAGNSATDALVDAADVYGPYDNQTAGGQAPITSPYDVNRDRTVDAIDIYLPYYHQTSGPTALVLLNLSAAGPVAGSGLATLQLGSPLSQAGMRQLLSEGRIEGWDPATGLPTGSSTATMRMQWTAERRLLAALEAGPGRWQLEWTGDLASGTWQAVESGWELEATGRGWWLDWEEETAARFYRVVEGRSQAQ
ncbi:MAG: hypothetical protein H7A47_10155 [Verrucomicrobiales bacterium]|nr:hypothetical protein [Verrucomicrobiales bacterium]